MIGFEIISAVVSVAALIVAVDAFLETKRRWGENYE